GHDGIAVAIVAPSALGDLDKTRTELDGLLGHEDAQRIVPDGVLRRDGLQQHLAEHRALQLRESLRVRLECHHRLDADHAVSSQTVIREMDVVDLSAQLLPRSRHHAPLRRRPALVVEALPCKLLVETIDDLGGGEAHEEGAEWKDTSPERDYGE